MDDVLIEEGPSWEVEGTGLGGGWKLWCCTSSGNCGVD